MIFTLLLLSTTTISLPPPVLMHVGYKTNTQTLSLPQPNFTKAIVPMPDGSKMVVEFKNNKLSMHERKHAEILVEVLAWIVAFWMIALGGLAFMGQGTWFIKLLMFGVGCLILLKLTIGKKRRK